MGRIITVTSGKGGVGKTSIGVNTAVTLAAMGKRVCLFDADLGLANVNILLGIYPRHDLSDVITGEKRVEEIIIRNCYGIDIIPGSSGVAKLADLTEREIETLIEKFKGLKDYDFVIVDTSAGISKSVIAFCAASVETVLVLTPEPTSMTDGYSLLKVLAANRYPYPVMVAVNQCTKIKVARIVFDRFQETVRKFLPIRLLLLGPVVKDPVVARSVLEQKPFVSLFPDSLAAKCIRRIGELLVRRGSSDAHGFDSFLLKCMDAIKGGIEIPGKRGAAPATGGAHEKSAGKNKPAGEAMDETINAPGERPAGQTDADVSRTVERLESRVSELTGEIAGMRRILETLADKVLGTDQREDVPARAKEAEGRALSEDVKEMGDGAPVEEPRVRRFDPPPKPEGRAPVEEPAETVGRGAASDAMDIGDEPLRIALDFEAYVRSRKTENPQKTME